jgi:F0F1-type ATP synthase assembly protein I
MGIVTGSIFVIIGYLSGTPFGMCLGSILGMGAMGSIILMGMEVLDI